MTPKRPDRATHPASDAESRELKAESGLSRRDFVLRAGQLGALAAAGAALGSLAWPDLAGATSIEVALDEAGIGTAPPMTPIAALSTGLRWRMLGPFRGGRVAAATGVPGRPNEFYFGAVNGGVWKSIDAGRVWEPVFDDVRGASPSIGAIAVAPSAPDTVYVGTGESTLRDSASFGTGVYKSTDAGRTWTHLGLAETHHIGKIAVDPRDPDTVFVAAIGKLYAANPERGLFRSTDGGRTWTKVLGDENVGAVEVVIDPSDSRTVYAGLWNTRRPPWFTYAPTNGPGGGIFKSTDGGTTWTRLTHGLPGDGIGRTGIAVAPSNPRRVYAVVDCLVPDPSAPPPPPTKPGAPAPRPPQGQGGVFRSDDAGATWTKLSGDPALWGRGWYFEKIAVDPKNADIVYVPNVAVNRSTDGGRTWVALRGSPGGDDYHQAWISPDDTNTMIVASDQGAIVTRNATADDPRVVTWSSWLNQPTAQLYHISVDYRFPYWVTGAQQDSGAVAVRSRGKFAEISTRDWEPIGAGGESGYTAGDPLTPGIIMGGTGTRYDLATNRRVPGTTSPKVPTGEVARADWTQPLVFSRKDPTALYYANQYLFRSGDHARSWTRISPDLTRPNPGIPTNLDAAAAAQTDRNGKRGVIYTIAPSPLVAPLLWVGTDDGLIQLTTDDGATWTNVTPPAIGAWSRVTMLEASHFDADACYASVDRHQLQDYAPYVFRTRDRGRTWQKITTGLPANEYVHVVREDPKRRGLLFAGTERGAWVSLDDGDSWQPLQLNLPTTSVRDFELHGDDLVVGTFGRGIWVMDDITPLRQITNAVLRADAYLFQPADTTLVSQEGDQGTPLQKDEPQTPNAFDGATIYYFLRSPATSGPVTLEILDASGGTVLHTFSSQPPTPAVATSARGDGGGGNGGGIPRVSPLWQTTPEPFSAAAGLHRVVWNPVSDAAATAAAAAASMDEEAAPAAPLTGTFSARLTVGGTRYTRQFVVRPDPRGLPR